MNVSACLVTRGDHDLTPIRESLEPFVDEIIVYDNSKRHPDLKAYGRYEATRDALNDLCITQDDDVILHCIPALIAAWQPGSVVVNRQREDVPWVGWGAVFDRRLPERAHDRYLRRFGNDAMFLDFCDAIFTMQVPVIDLVGAYEDLPWANDSERTSMQPDYYSTRRPEALRRISCITQP